MTLPGTIEESHKAIVEAHSENEELRAENEQLRREISWLKRHLFGQKSERRVASTPDDQLDLFGGQPEATEEEIREERKEPPRDRRRGKQPLPKDLPREEITVDVPQGEKTCECGREKKVIGEDVTERLEIVPARLFVKKYIRPRYACPCCKDKVVQALLPEAPLGRAAVEAGLLAYLIVSKYADHLPLCRLERIFSRHGIELPRARMCDWLMEASELLRPVYTAMKRRLCQSAVLCADETPLEMQSPGGRGKTDRCWLWVYRGDDAAPYTVFDFHPSRGRDGPREILKDYTGFLQTDDYAVYGALRREEGYSYREVRCWAHARRKFVEAEKSGDQSAAQALAIIGRLYEIEREAADKSADDRLAFRQGALPILAELKAWMEERLATPPKSPLGQAIGYTLDNWQELGVYTTDGRLAIDNNATERAIRPVAIGRKNWLFAGSERGGHAAALFFTLIDSARRAELNPFEYLRDLLSRIGEHPISRIEELLPDRWQPQGT